VPRRIDLTAQGQVGLRCEGRTHVLGVPIHVSRIPEFWRRPFRLIRFNLRKADARRLDAKRLVAQVIDCGASGVLISAGDILPWSLHPQGNDYPSGDVMALVVRECHRQGLKALVCLDASKAEVSLYDRHPDWFQVSAEGEVERQGNMLLTCFQGPYWQERIFALVNEIISRYPVDGFFCDHLWHGHCTCRRCRDACREKTGLELPWHEDSGDPSWRAYIPFRYQEVADYAGRLHSFVHRLNPRAIFAASFSPNGRAEGGPPYAEGLGGAMGKMVDVITCEAPDGPDGGLPRFPLWAGQQACLGLAMGENQAVTIVLPYSGTTACPRAAQPPARLVYDLMQVVAHGAQPCVQMSGTLDQDDRKALPAIKSVYRYLRDHSTSYEGLASAARVALVYSQSTVDFYGRGDALASCLAEYRGFYEALVASHVQFDLLHDAKLDAARLSDYDLVILPGVAALSNTQAAMFDAYVEAGGHIVASFETGLYDHDGQPRDVLALRCLGRFLVKCQECTGGYLRILDKGLLPGFEQSDLLGLRGTLVVTGPLDNAGSQVTDLHLIAPAQASGEEVDTPGLVLAKCGIGEAAYLPWQVGALYHLYGTPECRQVIADLVRRWVPPLATTNAPGSVEVTLHHPRGDRNRCLVHLLNSTGWQGKPLTEVIPVRDVSLWVRGPYVAARELSTGQGIALTSEEGGVRLELACLESFAAIELVAAGASFAAGV